VVHLSWLFPDHFLQFRAKFLQKSDRDEKIFHAIAIAFEKKIRCCDRI